MAEIAEALDMNIVAEKFKLTTNAHTDKLVVSDLALTTGAAATLAWLINQSPETELTLELKVKS